MEKETSKTCQLKVTEMCDQILHHQKESSTWLNKYFITTKAILSIIISKIIIVKSETFSSNIPTALFPRGKKKKKNLGVHTDEEMVRPKTVFLLMK